MTQYQGGPSLNGQLDPEHEIEGEPREVTLDELAEAPDLGTPDADGYHPEHEGPLDDVPDDLPTEILDQDPGVQRLAAQDPAVATVLDDRHEPTDSEQIVRDLAEAAATDRIASSVLPVSGIWDLKPPEYLVDGMLIRDSLAAIYGPPGSMKTFLALDLSLSVALGRPWHGRPVQEGKVVYVMAEGLAGTARRVEAWLEHRDLTRRTANESGLTFISRPLNLSSEVERTSFAALDEVQGADLIVLDTLARCIPGVEENSAKEMSAIVDHLDALRSATGANVLVVHHSGKDIERGMRGSTVLLGAVDTTISVETTVTFGDEIERATTVSVRKQKDDEPLRPMLFKVQRYASSIALVLDEQENGSVSGRTLDVLNALTEIEDDYGVTHSQWFAACAEAFGCTNSVFGRARNKLLDEDLVVDLAKLSDPPGKRGRYVTRVRLNQAEMYSQPGSLTE